MRILTDTPTEELADRNSLIQYENGIRNCGQTGKKFR